MVNHNTQLPLLLSVLLTVVCSFSAHAADKPIKTFICAGQSNMVGWGDSKKLPGELRKGNDRALMFEDGKWQLLRPFEPANQGQKRAGLTEFHFGPEIALGQEMAKAWPDETIGIIKLSIGGTSLLAWKPDWSKEDADRVGQGRHGSLYKRLMEKVAQARKARDIEIVGFLWLQGGGDMKQVDVAKEYLVNLKSLVTAVRQATGVPNLPFIYGTARQAGIPDDLSGLEPKRMEGRYPAAQWVLKAQFDAQKAIPNSKMVILRDIEKHPRNVHYNTAGQLKVGKLFAEAFLQCAAHEDSSLGGKSRSQILTMLGAQGEAGARPDDLAEYRRIFGFLDTNDDGNLSTKEFIEEGRYMTREARQGIFGASDANGDDVVSKREYITNRIITDEAKAIMAKLDENGDGIIAREEFIDHSSLPEGLSEEVFHSFDTDGNDELVTPEYLRVWGSWARSEDADK